MASPSGSVGVVTKRQSNQTAEVNQLAISVTQLTEEVRILRMAIDELRDDVVWAARQVLTTGYQVSGKPPPPPRDPLAPDADYVLPRTQVAEVSDELLYCCDSPALAWHGPTDAPGIACTNCGYLVADEGSVVIWRDEAETGGESPAGVVARSEHQAKLFE